MCGRFALGIPRKKLAEHFGLEHLPEAPVRYNIAPSRLVEAVAEGELGREARLFRWGFVPFFAKDAAAGRALVNARAETVAVKPAFRAAFKYRRCLVMAQAFYEWRAGADGRQPYAIGLESGEPMGLAGLWEAWRGPGGEEIESCAVITCAANELIAPVHERMPVIVPPRAYAAWLGSERSGAAAPVSLLVPYPAAAMYVYPVSRAVNNPEHDAPDCLLPLE